ncbi:CpsB/CapC family capsule biosynthesis tyrosine phosphatase [Pedobacter sp. B4-66]|uniref:tyrosine-protein phosphatase n=1 Tax=Pedobacter sp. B4-66 TaxID=2817280 RepID=UPI001BD93B5C|nr:CpsB/CapC family capsule biosynthesis tyrosine phosphatase [Pedobacter sp. B4-66]
MFFFNRSKKSNYTDFNSIGIDMHSHLIPGVDDGAKDIQDSIKLISGLKELGFHHLITTPHTLQDIHPNTTETLKNGHSKLDGKLPEGITLNLSSEYYLDEQFQGQLNEGNLMPLPGNRLLVEFSQISRPHDLEEVIFDIGIKGYQVILAHPERYLFFHKHFDYYKRIKEMGVELQVNALSLTEHYGKHIKSIAEKLIEKDMIDFIGTDIHHVRHLETLKRVPSSKYFARLVDSGLLKNKELI